jgi:phage shock protein PspC (stress-responsive transcriptional regulator)
MNEVTKIHLGRQAFTVSMDAHKELRDYLDAIKKQVGDKDVVDEVELRMAELLAEHGITGEKVILPADVNFLKEQLGNPKDFKEDADTTDTSDKSSDSKRLFRDTGNAMLAGVAAGLAEYFGIDVLLIRILFVISIITGGWGIVVYLVLWLLVPEAKTSSDRLQMAGKSVTVESLKEVVGRADVKGAAQRANNSLAGPINTFFRTILKLIGVAFIVAGLSMIIGLIGAGSYWVVNRGNWLKDNIFPIGFREDLLVYLAFFVVGAIAIFIILFGMAIFRRRWPIRTWITGMLIGLVLIALAIGGALSADVVPQVRDRYNANVHTVVRSVKPFTDINPVGNGVDINYQSAGTYSVSLNYYGNPNLGSIKTKVTNGTLLIDSSGFDWHRNCQALCIPDTYNMVITVSSPNPPASLSPDVPIKPIDNLQAVPVNQQ